MEEYNPLFETYRLLRKWFLEGENKKETAVKTAGEGFTRSLFSRFLYSLPSYFSPAKTVPFSYIYYWFSWEKFDKQTAREIIDDWVNIGLCEYVRYRGVKIMRRC